MLFNISIPKAGFWQQNGEKIEAGQDKKSDTIRRLLC